VAAADVVVVGAGAIGAACAYELARAGARVTVLERGEPGGEASGASAGILTSFAPRRGEALAALARLGRDLHDELAAALLEETGIDVELGRTGHLDLCMTEDQARRARGAAADPAHRGEALAFVSPDELRRLEPAVTPRALGALHAPRSSWVDNVKLVQALVRASERRGARLRPGVPVQALLRRGDRVTGVRTVAGEVVGADRVVLAAGAWSGAIAGVPPELAVRPVKGQILAFANRPPRVRHVVFRNDVYLVPRLSGECLVGATVEEGVADRAVTLDGLRWLLEQAAGIAPGLADAPFLRVWAGLRPASPDGVPVVGPWPGLEGLVVATGHHRSGILLAPVTGRLVREWTTEGRTTVAADVLLPDRLRRAGPEPR
jgi:glycine oxidase